MSNDGFFLTVEGAEGVGKSTAVTYICNLLDDANIQYICTREPGGTPLGEALRDILLQQDTEFDITANAELLLMFAARMQHIETVIKPALEAGLWVVCDRFIDASYAYQGGGRQISDDRIQQLAHWVLNDLHPDLTLLFDAPIEVGMARARQRGPTDRFEQEQQVFFERVSSKYRQRAAQEPERIVVIDASQAIEQVQSDIRRILNSKLNN